MGDGVVMQSFSLSCRTVRHQTQLFDVKWLEPFPEKRCGSFSFCCKIGDRKIPHP